ncbi:MAG: glutamate-1-semialdehyde 2,1-aminomutase [Candidatus Omnitrophica bacterium]|nr:glutamate-1-semialdehyde 2,1-aminomutase [Candidatus Omnitrophota bacterium]MBU4590351.1 glutamate-1-semialdehyde 2,1-aminomutase [Candidatus Omnitrophota bacterium]
MVKLSDKRQATSDKELFSEARRFIPGGVNSPVRSFKAVGGSPVFIKKAYGDKIYSECGEEFIDYCLSWGALILGHTHREVIKAIESSLKNGTSFGAATRLETELAMLIAEAVPSIEQIRLTNSGTEAVMGAVRLARAYTGKNKIIKFQGSYHGHADYLLDCTGVPEDFKRHTIVVPYNDIGAVLEAAELHREDLAAIIVEPVSGNCGVVLSDIGFLQGLRKIADKYNTVLIFDEVITGFRVSYSGAQGIFGIKADITCLGKVIGGGLPVGAFGGRREIMDLLAPEGDVYQAGTLSGNPVAVTAGITTLKILKEINPYPDLETKTKKLCEGIMASAKKYDIKLRANYISSMFSIFFGENGQDKGLFKKFFHGLLKRGIYFSPSGFEANFLSTAHSNEDVKKTLDVIDETFESLRRSE